MATMHSAVHMAEDASLLPMRGRTCLCSCCRSFSALSERGREGRNVNLGVSSAPCRDSSSLSDVLQKVTMHLQA